MFHTLHHIRNRSRVERQALALGIAGGITGIIFVVWAISFLAGVRGGAEAVEVSENASDFTSIVESFQDATHTVGREVESVRESINSFSGEYQGNTSDQSSTNETSVVPVEKETNPVAAPQVEVTNSGIEIINVTPER